MNRESLPGGEVPSRRERFGVGVFPYPAGKGAYFGDAFAQTSRLRFSVQTATQIPNMPNSQHAIKLSQSDPCRIYRSNLSKRNRSRNLISNFFAGTGQEVPNIYIQYNSITVSDCLTRILRSFLFRLFALADEIHAT